MLLQVKDLETQLCANPLAAGVPGSATYKAKCYEIIGTVVNKGKEPVNNADVYGQVFGKRDHSMTLLTRVTNSTNDPVLRSGRVGSIQDVPV
eukprot:8090366-Pyramimonas_sp.AAC.1